MFTEDEFWAGPDSVQNTGPGRKTELRETLSPTIRFDKAGFANDLEGARLPPRLSSGLLRFREVVKQRA